jgi:hypothetical protein
VRHESRLLGVADPHATGVEINLGIMLHQWEDVVAAARRDHKLMSDGHLPQSEDPVVGRAAMTDRCSFPIVKRGERAQARRIPPPQVQGEPWCAGGD